MLITVLAVPDCPNAPLALQRIDAALAGRSAQVELVEVHDEEQAAALGMTGSPTILVDGVDPFASSGALPSISCRLGIPSVAALREALARPDLLKGVRAAALSPAARRVHQAILRTYARTGQPPTHLDELDELVAADLVVPGPDGLAAAYPFSTAPTAHRLAIGDTTAYAMCAIDALGVSAMLGQPVTITSAEPGTGRVVTVHVDGASARWDPDTAVVYAADTGDCCVPSADRTCGYINFFGTPAAAHAWGATHLTGVLLDQAAALDCAIEEFGGLLS